MNSVSLGRDALVVKLLGKNVGYVTTKDRLQRIWKLKGGFDILDIDNGCYMVKFDLSSDKEIVTLGDPWMVFDHYLCIFNWTPEFASFSTGQGSGKWFCICLYANLIPSQQASLWDYLCSMGATNPLPWVLIVDFNEIIISDD